jgi:hypothetical protein
MSPEASPQEIMILIGGSLRCSGWIGPDTIAVRPGFFHDELWHIARLQPNQT